MFGFGLLSGLIFLPLVGAGFIFALQGDDEPTRQNARYAALFTTLITFVLSLIVWSKFDASSPAFQLLEEKSWFGAGLVYKLGVDGMSLPFVLLTTFLMPICILASWKSITYRVKEYMIAFLVLETLMIGVFCALDLLLFYLFFEGGLIPMFLIIGIWGGKRRVYASFKFFLYTLAGSLLMLLAVMAMYGVAGTTDITVLLKTHFSASMQTWLWLAFFASFAVKMPMWPVHTWLPDAHVEAPTAGSVILAGILLKMGGYGFIRFSLPMFPDASLYFAPLVFALSVIAIIYTSLVALVQEDMKKLIAYSSVAHMGFVTMGLFAMTEQGVQGAIFQMVSHGLVSGALFLCVGVVYDRMHTREISAYGGLVERMPLYAVAFMVFTMANIGLPGTSGFIGEFLTMLGTFRINSWVALFSATGVILSAAYALYLYRRIIFGVLDKPGLKDILDLSGREIALLGPLLALTLYYGIHPGPILDTSAASVQAMIKTFDESTKIKAAAAVSTQPAEIKAAFISKTAEVLP
jgi:NADH-quinone oxidoreductase subunit M